MSLKQTLQLHTAARAVFNQAFDPQGEWLNFNLDDMRSKEWMLVELDSGTTMLLWADSLTDTLRTKGDYYEAPLESDPVVVDGIVAVLVFPPTLDNVSVVFMLDESKECGNEAFRTTYLKHMAELDLEDEENSAERETIVTFSDDEGDGEGPWTVRVGSKIVIEDLGGDEMDVSDGHLEPLWEELRVKMFFKWKKEEEKS